MSEFEYISVLMSIIIGLGITQLLSGFARLVRDGYSLAPAWWVMVLVANILLGQLQVWWITFIWRELPHWTFFGYATLMILPALLYLLAYLVFPADLHLDGKELVRAFIAKRKPFFTILALVPIASFFQQWMFTGELPDPNLDTVFRLFWIAIAIPGFISKRIAVQAALAVVNLIVILSYICLLFIKLPVAS